MNADGLHSGHGIFTRRVAREVEADRIFPTYEKIVKIH